MRWGAALLTVSLCAGCGAQPEQSAASTMASAAPAPQAVVEPTRAPATEEPSAAPASAGDGAAQPAATRVTAEPTTPPCDDSATRERTGFRGRMTWRGLPVPEYRVELRAWRPPFEGELYASATTDAAGAFELTGSPIGEVGLWIPRQPPYVFRGYRVRACGGQVRDLGDVETFLEITGLSIREGQVVEAGPLTITWDALEQAERFCVGLFSGGRAMLSGTCDGHLDEVAVEGTSFTTPPLTSGAEYFFEISAIAGGHTVGEPQAGIIGIVVR